MSCVALLQTVSHSHDLRPWINCSGPPYIRRYLTHNRKWSYWNQELPSLPSTWLTPHPNPLYVGKYSYAWSFHHNNAYVSNFASFRRQYVLCAILCIKIHHKWSKLYFHTVLVILYVDVYMSLCNKYMRDHSVQSHIRLSFCYNHIQLYSVHFCTVDKYAHFWFEMLETN